MKLNKVKMVREAEVAQFEQVANQYGMYKTSQGKTFTANGKVFTIDGLRAKSKKMPVIATDVNGEAYKFAAEYVVEQLKAQAAQKAVSVEAEAPVAEETVTPEVEA